MPLHENLERKRRENVPHFNAIGACHICGSTCRRSHFQNGVISNFVEDGNNNYDDDPMARFIDADDEDVMENNNDNNCIIQKNNVNDNNNIQNKAPIAHMRTCPCFDIPISDPNHWPFSLRVCEMCISDDDTTGRIRCCGICGTVACDENCGEELVECTDSAEWNNAGCLECRGKESFSDLAIFKQIPPHGHPRMTRICSKCLDQATPWVKYDFVCRRFKCKTRLVPSDVAERKRFRTFGSSPLNLLPEDGLLAIVDFLSGRDLKQLYLTNSAMCRIAERVARRKVEKVNGEFPTGPISEVKKNKSVGVWLVFEGTNEEPIRVPEDCKSWVGVFNYFERFTKEAHYFRFQMRGGDKDAASRYLQREDKFAFGPLFVRNGDVISERESLNNTAVNGGHFHVVKRRGPLFSQLPSQISIAASDTTLETGVQRIICRAFCPSPSDSPPRHAVNDALAYVGIIRKTRGSGGNDSTVTWAHKVDVLEGWTREEGAVGLEYNTNTRVLSITKTTHRGDQTTRQITHTLEDVEGELRFAVEFSIMAVDVANSLLSVRKCTSQELGSFVSHYHSDFSTESTHRRARDRIERVAAELNEDDDPGMRRILRIGLRGDQRRGGDGGLLRAGADNGVEVLPRVDGDNNAAVEYMEDIDDVMEAMIDVQQNHHNEAPQHEDNNENNEDRANRPAEGRFARSIRHRFVQNVRMPFARRDVEAAPANPPARAEDAPNEAAVMLVENNVDAEHPQHAGELFNWADINVGGLEPAPEEDAPNAAVAEPAEVAAELEQHRAQMFWLENEFAMEDINDSDSLFGGAD